MTIKVKAHVRAVTDLIEMMNVAAILALFGDCIWVTHDIAEKGASWVMVLIALSLGVGLMVAIFAAVKYHKQLISKILKKLSKEKKQQCLDNQRIQRKIRAKNKIAKEVYITRGEVK